MFEDKRKMMARDFADRMGWQNTPMQMVAGDASNRKYYRLNSAERSAILMDAPPEKGEDTTPFIEIANFLRQVGLSAPEIFEADTQNGFLLIEDFGDDLFARLLKDGAAHEQELYSAATDVLLQLHAHTPPPLAVYDAGIMADMAALSVTWYADGITGQDRPELIDTVCQSMLTILTELDGSDPCLIQRDYHAENLLWLPTRQGVARVGLLDFQDAMIGHKAYDLVSVLQDARRDVPHDLAQDMCDRYIEKSGQDEASFLHSYHLLGLQRNLRILGVFARLCVRDGKPHYVDLIPRVWGHVETNLAALARDDLSKTLLSILPSPTPDILDSLKAKCATHQTPS